VSSTAYRHRKATRPGTWVRLGIIGLITATGALLGLAPVGFGTTQSAAAVDTRSAVATTELSAAAGGFATTAGLGSSAPVPAGAIYVSPTGSDRAPGTRTAPLLTVAAGLAKARSGATVVLRTGDYRESLPTITRRVTLRSYPGERATLKGSVVVNGWVRDGARWRHDGWTTRFCHTCFASAAVDSAHPLAGWPDQAFRNGRSLRQQRSAAAVGPGEFAVDYTRKAIWIGDDPRGATVEASTQWRALAMQGSGAAGSVIDGLGFAQYAPYWREDQPAAVIVNAPKVTVQNSTFTQIAGTPFILAQPGARFLNNVSTANGYRGGNVNRAHGLVLSGNVFSNNNTEGFNTHSCGAYCTIAGVKVTHTKTLTVTDNVFSGNDGAGFWCDLGCIDARITRNLAQNNSGNGLFYEVSTHATIASNVIAGNGRGLKIAGSDRVQLWNNTFSGNALNAGIYDDPRPSSQDSWSSEHKLSWNTTGLVMRNNLVVDNVGSHQPLVQTNATRQVDAPHMFATLDNDVYVRRSAGVPSAVLTWATGSRTLSLSSVAQVRSATGRERNGVGVNGSGAVFANAGKGDFRVRHGSAGDRAGAGLPSDVAQAIGVRSGATRVGALLWPGSGSSAPTPPPSPTPTPTPTPTPSGTVAVALTSPTAGTIRGTVTMGASVTGSGVRQVTFYANGYLIGADSQAPYRVGWDTTRAPDSTVDIVAVAKAGDGSTVKSATTTVRIANHG